MNRRAFVERYTAPEFGDGVETCMACDWRVLPGDALCSRHRAQRNPQGAPNNTQGGAINVDIARFALHWSARGYTDPAIARITGYPRRMIREIRDAENMPSASARCSAATRWACTSCGRSLRKQTTTAPRCACGERMKRHVDLGARP